MAERNSNVRLLAVLTDMDDVDNGDYRFLVNEKDVKYVTIAPGSLPKDDRTFAPILIPLLPKFPPGDWNEGHVSKNEITGELEFATITTAVLPRVENNWHPVKVDHLELVKLDRFRQNIHKVTHPRFPRPMVVKFGNFYWEIPEMELETAAYQSIVDAGVGPAFLGHVTEAGRTIGFLLELVDGARAASAEDLSVCQRILSKLHGLGFKHGDINRFNFLVRDGSALMVDFETMKKCEAKEELEEEYNRLAESLSDPSFRGGTGSLEVVYPP